MFNIWEIKIKGKHTYIEIFWADVMLNITLWIWANWLFRNGFSMSWTGLWGQMVEKCLDSQLLYNYDQLRLWVKHVSPNFFSITHIWPPSEKRMLHQNEYHLQSIMSLIGLINPAMWMDPITLQKVMPILKSNPQINTDTLIVLPVIKNAACIKNSLRTLSLEEILLSNSVRCFQHCYVSSVFIFLHQSWKCNLQGQLWTHFISSHRFSSLSDWFICNDWENAGNVFSFTFHFFPIFDLHFFSL